MYSQGSNVSCIYIQRNDTIYDNYLIKCSQVEVEVESSDKGGNLIGSMFVDGKNLAVLLLEAGLCKVFAPSAERSQYGRSLFDAEEVAKNARKKLWEVGIISVNCI